MSGSPDRVKLRLRQSLLPFFGGVVVSLAICLPFMGRQGPAADPAAENANHESRTSVSSSSGNEERKKNSAMAARLAAERRVEKGLETARPEADFNLIGDDGAVSREALNSAGVKDDKIQEVRDIVNQLWGKMQASLSDRVYIDEAKSQPAEGKYVYVIPANRTLGDQLLADFEGDLARSVGGSAADILVSGLHPRLYFGWFGKFEGELEVTSGELEDGRTFQTYSYKGKDPKSGDMILEGRYNKKTFEKFFGKDFKLPDEE